MQIVRVAWSIAYLDNVSMGKCLVCFEPSNTVVMILHHNDSCGVISQVLHLLLYLEIYTGSSS
jgi:hypothetical protein